MLGFASECQALQLAHMLSGGAGVFKQWLTLIFLFPIFGSWPVQAPTVAGPVGS